MTHEELKKLEENIDKYKKALTLVYADGDCSSVERNRLISLKNELGLSDSICMVMESNFHEVADQDAIDLEKAKKVHHCHLLDGDGAIKWHGIDHSMIEYLEVGDTYIEASNGGSYTGLREPFVLSIGQSFKDLLDEYGERHIYDAVNDGKLQVFDEQNDLEFYLKLRFDIRDEEQILIDYQQNFETPELKTYHVLKEEDVKNLEIISDDDFSDIVDSIILNDYKHIPNAVRLPNLNSKLSEKLGLSKDSAFILKKSATHIRPDRKGGYGQAFDTEEYRLIPQVLREATFAVVDTYFKNFQIVFDDKDNDTKINKLVFNKDELGNYLLTIGKVDRESAFSEERNTVVAVGVAPTIQTLRARASSTALRASTTTVNESISQNSEKSNNRDWEQKYSFLSSDKLHSFINEESFTKDMAQMIICDFESDGSPLVIDELGNVCEKNIWESEEDNAIIAYMPSGITTKEIEILDSFLIGHPDIPAKKRVEVLKLKDTLEEINERLIEREEKQESLESEISAKIKTETFDNIPQWAVTYLAYGDKDGLSDEDIALADNWAKRNQIASLIGAGEERYFSSHPEFGLASDCVTATFSLRERTRTEKELVDDYISKVKEHLTSTSKAAVEEVFESSKIALQSFSDNEKKIIGKYLFDNGGTNDVNLGKLLKQKIEPEHKKEIKREIDFERER